MNTEPRTAQVLEFVDLVADVCLRNRRAATISLYLTPDELPLVVVLDDPCTDGRFHSEMSDAAETCDMHRTRSVPEGRFWEYHYIPLPEVAELLGDE